MGAELCDSAFGMPKRTLSCSSCSSGQFACGFSDPSAVLPGLAVAGFGDVNLPLDPG